MQVSGTAKVSAFLGLEKNEEAEVCFAKAMGHETCIAHSGAKGPKKEIISYISIRYLSHFRLFLGLL
jgi:hypothetical protein